MQFGNLGLCDPPKKDNPQIIALYSMDRTVNFERQ